MGVRKIRGVWHVDITYLDKKTNKKIRKRVKSPDDSKYGAKTYESQLEEMVRSGIDPFNTEPIEVKKDLILEEFSKEFYKNYVLAKNKNSEIIGKRSMLDRHLIPFFGSLRLEEVNHQKIDRYIAVKISSGLKNKTINNHLTCLLKLLGKAVDWGYLEKVPRIEKPTVEKQSFDYLSFDEKETLLKMSSGTIHEMILFALETGVRLGELLVVKWENIDWRNNGKATILIEESINRGQITSTKSKKPRLIPLSSRIVKCLNTRKETNGFIFTDENGNIFTANKSRKVLYRLYKKIGMRRVGWHKMRHSYASHLAMRGAPMKAIKELLGHSEMRTTDRYSHFSESSLEDAVEKLDNDNSRHKQGTKDMDQEKFDSIMTSLEAHFDANNKTKTGYRNPASI